ncbi:unnamed protein product, partial [Laminaria digitata]
TCAWELDPRDTAPGTGVEDRFALYHPDGTYNGGYSFGGLACTGGLISAGGVGYTPAAHFRFVLYGPSSINDVGCPADLTGDRILNFFDISLFIQLYNAGGDFNGDGFTNFFDVSAFIQAYNAGCP